MLGSPAYICGNIGAGTCIFVYSESLKVDKVARLCEDILLFIEEDIGENGLEKIPSYLSANDISGDSGSGCGGVGESGSCDGRCTEEMIVVVLKIASVMMVAEEILALWQWC